MIKSRIQFAGNRPMISINGELRSPIAYTTYFHECGQWSDFIKSGHKMFFVNVSFTDLPINNTSGFSPFRTGVFDTDVPDYSEFDETVRRIVAECPDALIFPRINIAMPRKWIAEHPYETVATPCGNRESLISDVFLNDGSKLLRELLFHIRTAEFCDRIAGYQLCGGTTQEWFPHDLFGSYSEMGMEKFKKWACEKHGICNIKAPERLDFESGINTDEIVKYYEFCNEMIPKTIEHFARVTKEYINNEQIVGVFYGYNGFVSDPLWCTHGLRHIINSPYIDFFSSPCAYDDTRKLGLDWGDMIPVDSIKHHGKLCFIECDIRTHLTKRMQDSRPGEYDEDILSLTFPDGRKTVWSGPDTLEASLSAIRKTFAHQLAKGSGIWWFDMWGGWYHHPEIMNELESIREVFESAMGSNVSEVVLFIDEKAYTNIPRGSHLSNSVNNIRVALGNTGVPFDTYMVEDVKDIIDRYKFVIFSAPIPSMAGLDAMALCKEMKIPYICATEDKISFDTNELRNIFIANGVHCYNENNSVIYRGNGIVGIHTSRGTQSTITLPQRSKIKPLFKTYSTEHETNIIHLSAPEHSTLIYQIDDI